MCYTDKIVELIRSDEKRMHALECVSSIDLPDWLIAAGFVRNMVWDNLFGITTELNDIDVIYFCKVDTSVTRDTEIENQLKRFCPELPWSVKNQARMHDKNGDRPYVSTFDAMMFWPEKQTSVGARLDRDKNITIVHCFDLRLLFSGKITYNPTRQLAVFERRIFRKKWLQRWPLLNVEN